VKGFFKDACYMLRKIEGSKSKKLTTYKKEIDGLIFPEPRNITLELPDGEEVRILQRPLRAQTAQGERVALAASEMLPAGTTCDFRVVMMDDRKALMDAVAEWFGYGRYRGIGQWRNAGYGAFVCTVYDAKGRVLVDTLGATA
jgi:hypothetical protein